MKKLYTFTQEWEDTFILDEEENEIQEIKIAILVNENDIELVGTEMQKAYDNWIYEECENSILIDDETTSKDLRQVCIGDYILQWLDKLNIEYTEKENKQ